MEIFRILKKSLLILLIGSFLFGQRFDPNTGQLIELDSLKAKFNPETGQTFDSSTSTLQKLNSLEDWEVENLARRDAFQNFWEEELTYKVMGGPAALASIVPSIWLSMGLGHLLWEDEGLGLGFMLGVAAGAWFNPRFLSSVDSKPQQIILLQKQIQDLDDNQKNLYIKEYSKHIKSMRRNAINKGALFSMGAGAMAFIFFAFSGAI